MLDRVKRRERFFEVAPDMRTLLSIAEAHRERILFRYYADPKTVADMTYTEYTTIARRFAAGITALGLKGKRIAIIGETSPFWVAAYEAAIASGCVAVPMDKELLIDEIEGLLASAEVNAIVFSRQFNTKFAHAIAEHPTLQYFIPITPTGDLPESDKIIAYQDLLAKGDTIADYTYPEVEDINRMAEMLFTSGTTGTSKCVMLSQKNVMASINAACDSVNFTKDDTIVSVLPVHHTYELACMQAGLIFGATIAINDSIKHVLVNFKKFEPTGLVLVPLFVNTIYKRIFDEARKTGREKKLRFALKLSRFLRHFGIDLRRRLFRDVRESFGGNLEKIISGGAPLNADLCRTFFEFGIQLCEGYGITECSPLISVNRYYDPRPGSVGTVVQNCHVRIESTSGELLPPGEVGEIVVSGDNVMLGYYNNEEANKAVFTEDGWFRTGDMGYMDKDGFIFITGRIKSVIVLENGKNVFPEEIEEYLEKVEGVSECVVVGRKAEDGETIVLTAVIYPDAELFEEMEKDEIQSKLNERIQAMNKRLAGFKHIREIELRDEPFEKTTSRKIKRHLVK